MLLMLSADSMSITLPEIELALICSNMDLLHFKWILLKIDNLWNISNGDLFCLKWTLLEMVYLWNISNGDLSCLKWTLLEIVYIWNCSNKDLLWTKFTLLKIVLLLASSIFQELCAQPFIYSFSWCIYDVFWHKFV